MLEQNDIDQLAKALGAWLNFQIYCGRKTLLSEDYLSQPLAEFLTPLFPNRIEAEWTAPQFKKKGRGRPRQIDYIAKSRDAEHPVIAIEAKWIAEAEIQKQRILDDILRLEMLRISGGNGKVRYTQRLFLLAGTTGEMADALNAKIRHGVDHDFFPLFLPALKQSSKIEVEGCGEPIRPFFKDFADGYKVQLPKSYKVELVADHLADQVRVMVWRVDSSQKRQEFDASALWQDLAVPDSDDQD
jgi:hypothetical protein